MTKKCSLCGAVVEKTNHQTGNPSWKLAMGRDSNGCNMQPGPVSQVQWDNGICPCCGSATLRLDMPKWSTPEEMQDAVLPALFDQYENDNRHGIDFDYHRTLTAEEKPVFDSWIGNTLAHGWIEPWVVAGARVPGACLLTGEGYLHFKPRVDFLRAVQG